ncbi:hypothetical protein BBJ28_00009070 [Nothophytophthora sp. Chile5]|nr:hypothetical protein BBJ28_00009070 [Nothophytophthora sp. Chile5]
MVSGGKTPRRGAKAHHARLPGASALLQSDVDATHPSSRLLVWHSRFSHAASRHTEVVRGHAFNQQLEVCLPGAAGATVAQSLQWETGFYYEVRASVAMFLSPAFIREYVSGGGSVYMIAKNVAVDAAQSALLLPSGQLLLLVDADTYEQLGIVGEKYGKATTATCRSAHARLGQRYVITLDLTAFEEDADGNDRQERVRTCLNTKLKDMDMLICAYNERGAARTILFGGDDTVPRSRVELTGQSTTFRDVFLPRFDAFYAEMRTHDGSNGATSEAGESDTLRASLQETYDWLGLVACRLPGLLKRQKLEEYVSTYTGVPDTFECQEGGELTALRWRGLLATEFCSAIIEKLQRSVKSGELPWAAVTVWGFPDAFVSWVQPIKAARNKKDKEKNASQRREHGFLGNGSNHYTLLLLPDEEYFLLQALGPHDATV